MAIILLINERGGFPMKRDIKQPELWIELQCTHCPQAAPPRLVPRSILQEIVANRRRSPQDAEQLNLLCQTCSRVFQYRYAGDSGARHLLPSGALPDRASPVAYWWTRGCDVKGCTAHVELYGFRSDLISDEEWFATIHRCDLASLGCDSERRHQQTNRPMPRPTGGHLRE